MQAVRFPYSTYSRSLHITCPRSLHFAQRDSEYFVRGNIVLQYTTRELSITPLPATLTNVPYKYEVNLPRMGRNSFFHRAHQKSFCSRCEAIVMNKTFRSLQFVPASTWLQNSQKSVPRHYIIPPRSFRDSS